MKEMETFKAVGVVPTAAPTPDSSKNIRYRTYLQVAEFLDFTSTHGVPHIRRVREWWGKIFWTIMSLSMLGMLIYEVTNVAVLFSRHEYTVLTEMKFAHTVPFPAVTVCNINPLRKSQLSKLMKDKPEYKHLYDTIGWKTSNESAADIGEALGQSIVDAFFGTQGEEPEPIDYKLQYKIHQEKLKNFTRLRYEVASMDEERQEKIGHQLDTMLLWCQYNTYLCSQGNFTRFFNYYYGNCYTFVPDQSDVYLMSRAGAFHGLTIDLFLEVDEYVFDLADDIGARLLVHDPETMPFPDEDGISIVPGFQTEISVKKSEIARLGEPYYSCTKQSEKNIFSESLPNSYTRAVCYRSCYQANVVRNCTCHDARYPPGNFKVPVCTSENSDCLESLFSRYWNYTESLGCKCLEVCKEERYDTRLSMSKWPPVDVSYQSSLVSSYIGRNNSAFFKFAKKVKKDTYGVTTFEKNVARVKVFYEALDHQKISQRPVYTNELLISDIGGQLGLWMGISLVSVAEYVELLCRMTFVAICRRKGSLLSETPGKPVEGTSRL